ncbi:hypothetical protein Aph02nite_82610 [Actinoplanes philippinensis]|nr:hypothetical protein [Actinoplanes philippinensis]GIE82311.1 hypothetical protein Aph02nite_82610 [Actinoplanes philippinensis]
MGGEVPAQRRHEAGDQRDQHPGDDHDPDGGQHDAVHGGGRQEQGEPQAAHRRGQPGRHDDPSGDAVPPGETAAYARRELERAEHSEDGHADDVGHQGHRGLGDPVAVGQHRGAAGHLGQPQRARGHRHQREPEQPGRDQPVR